MSRARGLETLLFWLMALLGYAALAPCLVLPAWLEYKAQVERRKAADAHVAALERTLRAAQKQIEHLHNDPAYVLRLGEREFGESIHLPQVETVLIDPSPDGQDAAGAPAATNAAGQADDELLPELSAFFEQFLRRYPRARLFVTDATRPVLMTLGAVLLLTAIGLLGRAGIRAGGHTQERESGPPVTQNQ